MRVLVYNHDATRGEEREIPDDDEHQLDAMNEIVGGYIEYVNLTDTLAMIVNEEGLLHGLPVNKCAAAFGKYLVGNFFVSRLAPPEHATLTDADVEFVRKLFDRPETLETQSSAKKDGTK